MKTYKTDKELCTCWFFILVRLVLFNMKTSLWFKYIPSQFYKINWIQKIKSLHSTMVSNSMGLLLALTIGILCVSSGLVPTRSPLDIFYTNNHVQHNLLIRSNKYTFCIIVGCFRAPERTVKLSRKKQLEKAILRDYRTSVLKYFKLLGKWRKTKSHICIIWIRKLI